MTKYVLKSGRGKRRTYIYKSGNVITTNIDYEKFVHDLMKYASMNVDQINSEDDIKDAFTRIKNRGFDFHESRDSLRAVKKQISFQKVIYGNRTEYKRLTELKRVLNEKVTTEKQKRKIRRKLYLLESGRYRRELTDKERRILFQSLK